MSTIHFDSIDDFIKFVGFIYPEKKGEELEKAIKEMDSEATNLVQTIADNEDTNG